jgi:hypothetical protein
MRPLNGGNLERGGIIPPWPKAYEFKLNGWRLMVHTPTGMCWNRHLESSSITDEFKEALAKLKQCPFEWLDCEALSRRHKIGKGTLVVLDIPIGMLTYEQRHKQIVEHFQQMMLWPNLVKENEVYCLPSLTDWHGKWPEATWRIMQGQNTHHGLTGENVFFEGLVCKRLDSKYAMQLRSSKEESSAWIKHRFV